MVKINISGKYRENLEEVLQEDSSLKEEVNRKVNWFVKNPADTRLENHLLASHLAGSCHENNF